MHDLTSFESRLSERLDRAFGNEMRPFAAARIAADAIVARSMRDRVLLRLGVAGALPLPTVHRRALSVLAVVALALVVVALAIGLRRPAGELALVRTNGDVVIISPDGSSETVIGHIDASQLENRVIWAPDGGHLATYGLSQQLTIMDRTGTITYQEELADRFSQFAWSPDGQRLAIFDGAWLPDTGEAGPTRVHPDLTVVGPDGTVVQRIHLPDNFRYVIALGEIRWSPDGRELAISGYLADGQRRDFPSSIWVVDVAANTVRELGSVSVGSDDFLPRWLPDGRIIFSRLGTGVGLIDPATGAETILFKPDRACCGPLYMDLLEPSPDGSRVLVAGTGVAPVLLDIETGSAGPLDIRGASVPIAWTSDGRSIIARWAEPKPDEPYLPLSVATIDVETGVVTVRATEALTYDLRR